MIDVRDGQSLRSMNTLGFESRAEHYAEAPDEETLLELLALADRRKWPVFLLGGGSNVVLTRDLPGLTVRLTGQSIIAEDPDDGRVVVRADAGVGWNALVDHALESDLAGLENLALIPGTVGAAPVQNIGAYGVELADRLDSLRVWHRPGARWHELSPADCRFGYRDSLFKRERGDWIITSVTFSLGPNRPVVTNYGSLRDEMVKRGVDEPTAHDVARVVRELRRAKLPDPDSLGNVGSFFENPVVSAAAAHALKARFPDLVGFPQPDGRFKLAAGWLIDQLGFRGLRRHGIGVHERQALVLVNHGDGTAGALMSLADQIVDAVEARYGVVLVPEPLIV